MYEKVWVSLLGGLLASVALRVGHGTRDHQIVFLHIFEPFIKFLMVVGTVLLIDLICSEEGRVHGVEPYAALKTRPGFLPDQPHHFYFFHKIFTRQMDSRKAIDLFSRDVGSGG
ncbi:hypothetical protein SDC9_165132 [bioreactor metagenome]|uniref:Uncharacterized protein n=1 Tax=bioreactor metagenome TaxID=1076179 RepID=A0A645FTH8_9ZZZZ